MITINSKVIDEISVSDLVRKCFSAYELKDRRIIEDLLSDNFTFTSPLDNRIIGVASPLETRTEYFKRCWPNSENIRNFQIEKLVSKMADLDRLFTKIKQEQGHLDVVFANAGVGAIAPLGSITEEQFDRTFNINVKGLLFTVQKALPLLSEGASIILNASSATTIGNPALSVYSATKAAVRSFARSWTLDLKGRKIRVNAISPGTVPTPGYDFFGLNDRQLQEFVDSQLVTIPLGRVGTPDEIAKAVVFLASDDSSFVNGIELFVDGGMAQI